MAGAKKKKIDKEIKYTYEIADAIIELKRLRIFYSNKKEETYETTFLRIMKKLQDFYNKDSVNQQKVVSNDLIDALKFRGIPPDRANMYIQLIKGEQLYNCEIEHEIKGEMEEIKTQISSEIVMLNDNPKTKMNTPKYLTDYFNIHKTALGMRNLNKVETMKFFGIDYHEKLNNWEVYPKVFNKFNQYLEINSEYKGKIVITESVESEYDTCRELFCEDCAGYVDGVLEASNEEQEIA